MSKGLHHMIYLKEKLLNVKSHIVVEIYLGFWKAILDSTLYTEDSDKLKEKTFFDMET